MSREPVQSLCVNGVTVDFAAETLRDRAGAAVELRPRSFAVLRHMAANPDRLVGKEELMASVWPGLAVTDDSLVQCVHDIRRALGDEAHAVLKTVPRRGYRLVPPRPGPSAGTVSRRGRIAAAGAMLVLAAAAGGAWWWFGGAAEPSRKPMVAVLPFEALSEDESARLLAAGLTEDLIVDLARFPEFAVLARNSTRGYAGAPVDPRTVGAALDAGFVVEGSIARQADRVRITAQLVSASTGSPLWSSRWDRPAEDFFAVQSEISEAIANRLGGGAGLVQESGRNAARRKPPADLDAYELYLLGTEKLEKVTVPAVQEAVRLLDRAVTIEPGLARAWVELYHSHGLLANFGIEPERNREIAAAAAERALALDPSDAEAHIVAGSSFGVNNDFVRAKAEFDTALQLAPNAAEILTFYAGWASSFGEAQRGADTVDRVLRLDPNFPNWEAKPFGAAYFMAGRYREAVAMFDRLTTDAYTLMVWTMYPAALAELGRREEARMWVAKATTLHPDLTIERMANEPGFSDVEHRRFIETMRHAGFPPCADPAALATVAKPLRLPECTAEVEPATSAKGIP